MDLWSIEIKNYVEDSFPPFPYDTSNATLSEVPCEQINPELCKLFFEKNKGNLWFMPSAYVSEEMYLSAVEEQPVMIVYISLIQLSKEMCECAIEKHSELYKFLTPSHKTKKIEDIYISYLLNK